MTQEIGTPDAVPCYHQLLQPQVIPSGELVEKASSYICSSILSIHVPIPTLMRMRLPCAQLLWQLLCRLSLPKILAFATTSHNDPRPGLNRKFIAALRELLHSRYFAVTEGSHELHCLARRFWRLCQGCCQLCAPSVLFALMEVRRLQCVQLYPARFYPWP
jgi:hypothetical protein